MNNAKMYSWTKYQRYKNKQLVEELERRRTKEPNLVIRDGIIVSRTTHLGHTGDQWTQIRLLLPEMHQIVPDFEQHCTEQFCIPDPTNPLTELTSK